jgi:hypothetical protein
MNYIRIGGMYYRKEHVVKFSLSSIGELEFWVIGFEAPIKSHTRQTDFNTPMAFLMEMNGYGEDQPPSEIRG